METIAATKGRLATVICQHSKKVVVATSAESHLAKDNKLAIKPAIYILEN